MREPEIPGGWPTWPADETRTRHASNQGEPAAPRGARTTGPSQPFIMIVYYYMKAANQQRLEARAEQATQGVDHGGGAAAPRPAFLVTGDSPRPRRPAGCIHRPPSGGRGRAVTGPPRAPPPCAQRDRDPRPPRACPRARAGPPARAGRVGAWEPTRDRYHELPLIG